MMLSAYLHSQDNIVDIGCDHALLDIYLKNKFPQMKIVASDIFKGPLEIAHKNILKYGMEEKIELRLGDGLDVVDEKVDTIVISGMGTKTILNILKNINDYPWIKKMVLSPNNDFKILRREISRLNFKIQKEELVLENGKYYLIIEFVKGFEKIDEFFGKLDLDNSIIKDYYLSIYEKNKKILNNHITSEYCKELKAENKKIERKIK